MDLKLPHDAAPRCEAPGPEKPRCNKRLLGERKVWAKATLYTTGGEPLFAVVAIRPSGKTLG
ncbi:hypothetical protein GCM10022290_40370 [Sagittula marina]